MKLASVIGILFCWAAKASAFSTPSQQQRSMACLVHQDPSAVLLSAQASQSCQQSLADVLASEPRPRFFGLRMITARVAGLVSGLGGYVARGMAAEDLELAELPPPYVPALFGVVLLAGVGVLTASLGDVMEEEASLGLQSGARAKKEIERSRSSYFKRR